MKELFLLDPSVVYLNHGTFGACPRPVFEAYQGFQRELERQPIEFLALERRFPALIDAARLELAAYVGAAPNDLVFATNTSSALNAVIRSLQLGPGDEVLLGDAEYGGMEILWRYIADRTGAKLRRAPFAELDPGPDTRAVFCSHVEWTTGRVNDLTAVCSAARAARALSIVDGAHAPGQVDLDLDRLAPTSTRATATSGCAHRKARRSSTPGLRHRTRSSRSSSRGIGLTEPRSTSGIAGKAPATRLRSSPCRQRSRFRRSTTGTRSGDGAGHC